MSMRFLLDRRSRLGAGLLSRLPTRIGRGGAEQTELMMMMMMSASLGRRGASYRVGLATTRSRQHR